jgi:hypothetical protein
MSAYTCNCTNACGRCGSCCRFCTCTPTGYTTTTGNVTIGYEPQLLPGVEAERGGYWRRSIARFARRVASRLD